MDFLKTAFTMASTAAQQYYENYTKQEKLREQLKNCTYSDDVKLVIQKAVKQVFNVYPNFNTQILEFPQKGHMKRYLQLKSAIEIEIRGNVEKVSYFMMLPIAFPKNPPYVRILNQDPYAIVDKYYHELRSPTDPNSYILNKKLVQCRNWDETKSIVNIIIQSYNMLRQKFPFIKQQNKSASKNESWNNQMNYGNQNYNQYGGMSGANYGFNTNQNNNYQNSNANKPRPPIPFSTASLNQTLANGQNFVGSSKKIMEKLKNQHLKSVQKIQFLETVQLSLQSEEQYLRNQNIKMNNFLHRNQKSNIQDIGSLIRPADERSEQILDLTSSIRARQDCLVFLQSKLNDDQINFEQFIKQARKIEEEKFEDKYLLLKCIQKAK